MSVATVYDFLFRSTSDGVIIADRDGVITSVNPAGAAMLGQTPETLIGLTPKAAFNHNPTLVNLFTRSGDQTLDVRLPRRRLAVGIGATLKAVSGWSCCMM
ncbi:MAG: hypothetical protein Kow00117_08050 [Phototrophicales bacterium]